MNNPRRFQIVGLGAAVNAVVVRPAFDIVVDGAVPGQVAIGRGGMICNTLAVAAALGIPVGGIVANGDDQVGALMRDIVNASGVQAAYVTTRRTPVTVTIATGTTRSSIMGVDGEREADLDPDAVEGAWMRLGAQPVWVMLTLPALDSPAGARFVDLARDSSALVAVTLSSAGHVKERAGRLNDLLAGIDLVFGNSDETSVLNEAGAVVPLLISTGGEHGVTIFADGEARVVRVEPVAVVDATGAGDAFAAGVLSTLLPVDIRPANLEAIARAIQTGHRCAAVIIGQLGAEPGSEGRAKLSRIVADHSS